jgi:hypothetical protein
MTYMAIWLGGLTGSAFFYGVGWGLLIYPPVTWTALPRRQRPAASRTGAGDRLAALPADGR